MIYKLIELIDAWDEKRLVVKKESTNKLLPRLYDPDLLFNEEYKIMDNRYKILIPAISGEIKPTEFQMYIDLLTDELKMSIGSVSRLYKWKKRYSASFLYVLP